MRHDARATPGRLTKDKLPESSRECGDSASLQADRRALASMKSWPETWPRERRNSLASICSRDSEVAAPTHLGRRVYETLSMPRSFNPTHDCIACLADRGGPGGRVSRSDGRLRSSAAPRDDPAAKLLRLHICHVQLP